MARKSGFIYPQAVPGRQRAEPSVAVILQLQIMRERLLDNYQRLLEEIVFVRENSRENTKANKANQRILRSIEANHVLSILYRESDYVDDKALNDINMKRKFGPNHIIPTKIARMIAQNDDILAVISRVQRIVTAGCAYG